MSILRCSQCKGGVLSVASRCPHCGVMLPFAHDAMTAASRRPDETRARGSVVPLLATFLVGGLIIAGAVTQSSSPEATPAPTLVAVEPAIADAPTTSNSPAVMEPASSVRAKPASPVRAPVTRGRPMVASQWVNMREEPSRTADVLLVVPPQALVQADSSAPGWRRVAYDGAVGWVAEQHLVRQNQR